VRHFPYAAPSSTTLPSHADNRLSSTMTSPPAPSLKHSLPVVCYVVITRITDFPVWRPFFPPPYCHPDSAFAPQERYVNCHDTNHQLLIIGFNFRIEAENNTSTLPYVFMCTFGCIPSVNAMRPCVQFCSVAKLVFVGFVLSHKVNFSTYLPDKM
jgi:hypothetical protein